MALYQDDPKTIRGFFIGSCYRKMNNSNSSKKKASNNGNGKTATVKARARATKRMSNIERLREFLGLFKKADKVLIVIVADPDSMASAMAVKRLLSRRVESVTIAHPNEIKRVNNLVMQKLLKIPLTKLKSINPDDFTKTILLDSQPPHNPDIAELHYDAVIDHHPVTEGWEASFIDIRSDYGATSSMLTEYLKAAKIKPAVALATALFYGIKVDTQNFTQKASLQDVLCFQYLFKRINQNLLNRIETADFRKYDLKYFKAALENMKFSKNRIYSHVGRVANPDILVIVADFFTHVSDIGWVIVSGRCGDKLIVIFRCDGYKKDAGKLAKKVFGDIGSAGGHRQSARAEIPLKNLNENIVKKFSTSSLQRLILKHLQ